MTVEGMFFRLEYLIYVIFLQINIVEISGSFIMSGHPFGYSNLTNNVIMKKL